MCQSPTGVTQLHRSKVEGLIACGLPAQKIDSRQEMFFL
jgi:hypothetical protein